MIPAGLDEADHHAVAPVTGVQDAAEILVILSKCVRFVEQQSRARRLDSPKKRRGGDVGRAKGPWHQSLNGIEQGCLAASRLRRGCDQPRKDCEAVERVRADAPQSNRICGSSSEHNITSNSG